MCHFCCGLCGFDSDCSGITLFDLGSLMTALSHLGLAYGIYLGVSRLSTCVLLANFGNCVHLSLK